MIRIGELLDRDLSKPIEEVVKIDAEDPDIVYAELTEYVATDQIKSAYESLLSAMAAAPAAPDEGVGVWISGFFGSGKSSFAKNLGYVLADREVRSASASALFLKQVDSGRITQSVEFLNREIPCEVFSFDVDVELPAPLRTNAEHIAGIMYRILLRDLDYAEDREIAELEIELEKEGKLAAFEDLCRAEYHDDWRAIRKGSQGLARAGALLHRLDPRTYASTDSWLHMRKARSPRKLSVQELVERLFDLSAARRRGKTFAFLIDEVGEYVALGADKLEDLRAVLERFAQENLVRVRAGKIPGPAWIVVTAHETLEEYFKRLPPGPAALPDLLNRFRHRIDLSSAGIPEAAARRVLRKKESQESVLRSLFRERGDALLKNVKLERCHRRTEVGEDEFVRFYPYLPHLIDISIDAVNGIRLHPNAAEASARGNGTFVKQAFEMLVSEHTRLADQTVGVLVSLDKVYDLVEGNIPPEKRKDIQGLSRRFDEDPDYPGTAARVAKAICLMEFARADLQRTTRNIAALLVQNVTEAAPVLAVAAILYRMKEAQFVRWTDEGWKLFDLDEVRRATAPLEQLKNAIGIVNPRRPGWHNDLIQFLKKSLGRALNWYTRPVHEFNTAVSRALRTYIWVLERISLDLVDPERISANMAAIERLSMDIVALDGRLALSEKRNAAQAKRIEEQLVLLRQQANALARLQTAASQQVTGSVETAPAGRAVAISQSSMDTGPQSERTAYVIGLFGTGRRYVNDLILQNIGERAKYFRDGIRFHPGPTPMIYSGHATIKYHSRGQEMPAVMRRILEAARMGFADLIFVYRHPLDSLLTNWVWWRTFIRGRSIAGISQIYKGADDLSADLEHYFHEFIAFAKGDPEFFAGASGPPFLSFVQFVEETELHLQSATLALRLEDFMVDPLHEFSKIADAMSVELDLSRVSVAPPRTKPYGYLAVKDKVPRFQEFIDGLDAETKRRIEDSGYNL